MMDNIYERNIDGEKFGMKSVVVDVTDILCIFVCRAC